MDKVEVVLFRYKRERKLSSEFKKMMWLIVIPIILLVVLDIVALFCFFGKACSWFMVLCAVLMILWGNVADGKLGTKKWKYKLMRAYRDRFECDQNTLIKIIKEENLSCQQVYNLLTKKYRRMPQSVDNPNFWIAFLSLFIALTSIFASPLQNITSDYAQYIVYIVCLVFVLAPLGYLVYKVITAQNKQYDEKKKKYEYVIELLEDYLY